jgi:alcohol dehydrogenase, propanol-preferring
VSWRQKFLKAIERGIRCPLTPGHEVAGTIDSMGEELDGQFNKDDKVLVYPWVGDGVCPACIEGR